MNAVIDETSNRLKVLADLGHGQDEASIQARVDLMVDKAEATWVAARNAQIDAARNAEWKAEQMQRRRASLRHQIVVREGARLFVQYELEREGGHVVGAIIDTITAGNETNSMELPVALFDEAVLVSIENELLASYRFEESEETGRYDSWQERAADDAGVSLGGEL